MLRSVNSLTGYTVLATDGEVGKIDDLYFDEKTWGTAYAAVKVGGPTSGRRVFLPPTALGKPDWEREEFPVVYSKEQVLRSPDFKIGTKESREELKPDGDDAWVPFWMPSPDVGLSATLLANSGLHKERLLLETSLEEDDPYLQSANDVMGYSIHATDGKIGHVDDLLVDDSTWAFCYLVVAISRWLPRKKVLITPQPVNMISRVEGQVYVDLTMRRLKASPQYDQPMPISQEYESRLQEYYEIRNERRSDQVSSLKFH